MAQSSPNLLPLLIVAFWFSEALVAGLIAHNKGRTFWGYFLFTLFVFGPLGFLMALLVARKPPQTPKVEKHAMAPPAVAGAIAARSRSRSSRSRSAGCRGAGARNPATARSASQEGPTGFESAQAENARSPREPKAVDTVSSATEKSPAGESLRARRRQARSTAPGSNCMTRARSVRHDNHQGPSGAAAT